jgi:hypothetical protein
MPASHVLAPNLLLTAGSRTAPIDGSQIPMRGDQWCRTPVVFDPDGETAQPGQPTRSANGPGDLMRVAPHAGADAVPGRVQSGSWTDLKIFRNVARSVGSVAAATPGSRNTNMYPMPP